MECDIRKMMQRQFYFFGTYFLEERILDRWHEMATTARTVLDVGSNLGIFSLTAAATNASATVHAFEPTPDIASHFRRTISQNHIGDHVYLHQIAVAQVTGTAYLNFFAGERGDNEGMNFTTAKATSVESVNIRTISIDEFCFQQGITCLDLMKIDVQGNEPEVLAGAATLLRRKAVRSIFLELNWDYHRSAMCPASKALRILEDAGYMFADPCTNLEPPAFRAGGSWLCSLSDVIASPR